MSNSSLICYTKISPHRLVRTAKIDTITIHHMACNASVEVCGSIFQGQRLASSNYGIGSDGRIAMYVEEKDRAITSSSTANDNRAVTIEVANCSGDPDWKVSDKALESLINLCVDICQRNGIERLNYTGDKSGNLTMHKWFAPTSCPGPYLGGKFPWIAEEVNKRLGSNDKKPVVTEKTEKPSVVVDTKIDTTKEVQKWLNDSYAAGLVVDDIYGPKTQAALVKVLQKSLGVTADGVYGPQTNAAVKVLRKGSSGLAVKALQGLLVCNGYYQAYVDGDYGNGTYSAVVAYQKKKKLAPDGEAGRATFSALCK